MASRKIIWTSKANKERKEILEYWITRLKSTTYSKKLNNEIINATRLLAKEPQIGRLTNFEDIRVKIIRHYLLFYEWNDSEIKVMAI